MSPRGRCGLPLAVVLLLAGCGLKGGSEQLVAPPTQPVGLEASPRDRPPQLEVSPTSEPTSRPSPRPPRPAASAEREPSVPPLPPPPPPGGRLALPSHESDSGPAALLTGATFTADGDCVWLVDSQQQRLAVLFPRGWTADLAPLRLYDDSGREVWREPRVLDVGGGHSPVRVDRVPPACRVGDTAWWLMPFGP